MLPKRRMTGRSTSTTIPIPNLFLKKVFCNGVRNSDSFFGWSTSCEFINYYQRLAVCIMHNNGHFTHFQSKRWESFGNIIVVANPWENMIKNWWGKFKWLKEILGIIETSAGTIHPIWARILSWQTWRRYVDLPP